MTLRLLIGLLLVATALAEQPVTITFRAMVGKEELACGRRYSGIGITKSTITPRDFRFYLFGVRLLDENAKEVPLDLTQDGKWQLDDVALLDFEDATGPCGNGNPETNREVIGTVPSGHVYHGLRFTIGVPFEKNHTDLTAMPSPLNLTAMAWVWNSGRKFARFDFSSTGAPRGFAIHLGSTGCTPDDSQTTMPTRCNALNRPTIELADFDPGKDVVVADLAALLKDSNVDEPGKIVSGCMSDPSTPACAPVFGNLGLPFSGQVRKPQTFFRSSTGSK
ncbi:MAG: MbnP family copper-binding protein [Bryobacteraceae bacterium]